MVSRKYGPLLLLAVMELYRFNAVSVVSGELRIVRSLDGFIDDTIDNSEGVEVELNAIHGATGNLLVFFIEMVEELRPLDSADRTMKRSDLQLGRSVCRGGLEPKNVSGN